MDVLRSLSQRVPVIHLRYNPLEIDQTVLLEHLGSVQERNPYYVRLFLKQFLQACERSQVDLHEEVYETYCNLLSSAENGPKTVDVVSFCVGTTPGAPGPAPEAHQVIHLRETPKVISSNGTTGLRTWEAALYLSLYLIRTPAVLGDAQTVLELGTGTGVVGLALRKYGRLAKVILTDGDTNLLDNLSFNLQLNGLALGPSLSAQRLWWGLEAGDEVPPNDVIVAADVTYDTSVLASLLYTIAASFKRCCTTKAIIAATIRNEETIQQWEDRLEAHPQLAWRVLDRCTDPHALASTAPCWYAPGTPEIRIYEITPEATHTHTRLHPQGAANEPRA